jgi:excisionase family DNA binding protein
MDKKKAADYLKISVRQLQRHMSAKRISYTTIKTPRGDEAVFTREELNRFKKERREGTDATVHPAVDDPERQTSNTLETPRQGEQTALVARDALESIAELIHGLQVTQAGIIEQMRERPALAPAPDDVLLTAGKTVSIENKLMLTLPEAAELSGISVDHLRSAVRDGKLKTVKGIGGGYGKVKRAELDRFIKSL